MLTMEECFMGYGFILSSQSAYLSACLSVYLFVSLSVHLPVFLCLFMCLLDVYVPSGSLNVSFVFSSYLSQFYPLHLNICLTLCPAVSLTVRLPISCSVVSLYQLFVFAVCLLHLLQSVMVSDMYLFFPSLPPFLSPFPPLFSSQYSQ